MFFGRQSELAFFEKLYNSNELHCVCLNGATGIGKTTLLQELGRRIYQHIPAVQQGKIYPINYNEIVAPGCNLVQTLRYIRQCLET